MDILVSTVEAGPTTGFFRVVGHGTITLTADPRVCYVAERDQKVLMRDKVLITGVTLPGDYVHKHYWYNQTTDGWEKDEDYEAKHTSTEIQLWDLGQYMKGRFDNLEQGLINKLNAIEAKIDAL